MTDSLGPEARALLDAAREGLSPDAAALRRVRARVGSAAASGPAGASLAAKLGIAALVGVVAAGAAIYASRRAPPVAVRAALPTPRPVAPAPAGAPPGPTAAASPAGPGAPVRAIDEDLITLEDTGKVSPPAPAASATRGGHRARPSASRPAPQPGPADRAGPADGADPVDGASPVGGGATAAREPVSLSREVELVDRAAAALRQGDPRAALAAVTQHAIETRGSGQLAEDAAAIEIEALCQLGDPAVQARRAAFDARFPRSAQRARLATRCR